MALHGDMAFRGGGKATSEATVSSAISATAKAASSKPWRILSIRSLGSLRKTPAAGPLFSATAIATSPPVACSQ